VIGAGLFSLFFLVYFGFGSALADRSLFNLNNVFFRMDACRAIFDMTCPDSPHPRTTVHPLYVLMVTPLGTVLNALLDNRTCAAVMLNAALGAIGVALSYFLFLGCTGRLLISTFLAGVFGCTMGHLIISSVPETGSLAVMSLALNYILFYHSARSLSLSSWLWIPVGVFCLGVTTTNLAQPLIGFSLICLIQERQRQTQGALMRTTGRVALYGFAVLALGVALSLLQKFFYPKSMYFFLPGIAHEELAYVSSVLLRNPLATCFHLAKTFIVWNVVGPRPYGYTMPPDDESVFPGLTFSIEAYHTPLGYVALSLWLVLLGIGVWRGLTGRRPIRLFSVGLVLSLAFNFLLHCAYGTHLYGTGEEVHIEHFLYNGNFTLLALAFLGITFRKNFSTGALLGVFLMFLIAINNLHIMLLILAMF